MNLSEFKMNGVSYDNYHLVLSEEELDKVINRMEMTKEVSIDLETTSANPMLAQIVGIALSPAPHEACYVPVGHKSATPRFNETTWVRSCPSKVETHN
jgi:DNA polymerase I-like protein with 3'-5' exonuclease and polymerase domains